MEVKQVEFTVVVPALNEEEYIGACLESIRGQSVDCELIVVDSGSSDDTRAIASGLADKVLDGRKNIPYNRQVGLESARSEIVVSTDADCRHSPNWLEDLTGHFRDKRVVAVSGPTVPDPSESVMMDKACYLAGNLFLWAGHKFGLVWFRGSNSAYRRSIAIEAGGYDTSLRAREDSDLSQRVSGYGVTVFDWRVKVMTSMRRRRNTGWFKTIKYYLDTPASILRGKTYYEKA